MAQWFCCSTLGSTGFPLAPLPRSPYWPLCLQSGAGRYLAQPSAQAHGLAGSRRAVQAQAPACVLASGGVPAPSSGRHPAAGGPGGAAAAPQDRLWLGLSPGDAHSPSLPDGGLVKHPHSLSLGSSALRAGATPPATGPTATYPLQPTWAPHAGDTGPAPPSLCGGCPLKPWDHRPFCLCFNCQTFLCHKRDFSEEHHRCDTCVTPAVFTVTQESPNVIMMFPIKSHRKKYFLTFPSNSIHTSCVGTQAWAEATVALSPPAPSTVRERVCGLPRS